MHKFFHFGCSGFAASLEALTIDDAPTCLFESRANQQVCCIQEYCEPNCSYLCVNNGFSGGRCYPSPEREPCCCFTK